MSSIRLLTECYIGVTAGKFSYDFSDSTRANFFVYSHSQDITDFGHIVHTTRHGLFNYSWLLRVGPLFRDQSYGGLAATVHIIGQSIQFILSTYTDKIIYIADTPILT